MRKGMTTPSMLRFTQFAAVALVGLAACTSGDSTPTSSLAPNRPSLVLGETTTSTPETGKIKVCKSSDSNVDGIFSISRTSVGASTGTAKDTAKVVIGACRVVAEDASGDGVGSYVVVTETSAGFVSVSAQRVDAGTVTTIQGFKAGDQLFLNSFHGYTVTYKNTVEVPPPALCDFITFGRLVTESGGQKVVISGNAGGNAPGGGILGEFHVEVNGVDNHVATIDTYGPIASGALSGPSFPN